MDVLPADNSDLNECVLRKEQFYIIPRVMRKISGIAVQRVHSPPDLACCCTKSIFYVEFEAVPVTLTQFRRLALDFPDTIESAHMKHPDFRVRGKIFATLAYPNKQWGMVKLTPDQQEVFVADEPAIYSLVNGAWGRQGCTRVQLKSATRKSLRRAIFAAWLNAAPKPLASKFEPRKS